MGSSRKRSSRGTKSRKNQSSDEKKSTDETAALLSLCEKSKQSIEQSKSGTSLIKKMVNQMDRGDAQRSMVERISLLGARCIHLLDTCTLAAKVHIETELAEEEPASVESSGGKRNVSAMKLLISDLVKLQRGGPSNMVHSAIWKRVKSSSEKARRAAQLAVDRFYQQSKESIYMSQLDQAFEILARKDNTRAQASQDDLLQSLHHGQSATNAPAPAEAEFQDTLVQIMARDFEPSLEKLRQKSNMDADDVILLSRIMRNTSSVFTPQQKQLLQHGHKK